MDQQLLVVVFLPLVFLLLFWGAGRLLALLMQNQSDECPQCHKELVRIHRNPAQRVLSAFIPGLHRYECQSCGWQGMQVHRK